MSGPRDTIKASLVDQGDPAPYHRMFGWPELVQNPMQMECQLASSVIWLGDGKGYRDPRAAGLAPGAADWFLLLGTTCSSPL